MRTMECVPDCSDKECGDDGCGGNCSWCESGITCNDFVCECIVYCQDNLCGDDGCGGSCGGCPEGFGCEATTCVADDCVSDCEGKDCGPDGCGNVCGECPDGHLCLVQGTCFCVPDCDSKECGADGCGGNCGGCPEGWICDDFQCEPGPCVPDCAGKDCGPDGCGGGCGECGEGECVDGACVLGEPSLAITSPEDLESFPAGPEGTFVVVNLEATNFTIGEETPAWCLLDGQLDGTTDTGQYVFQDVPPGVHQLCCQLLEQGAVVPNCEATDCVTVKVLKACDDQFDDAACDDGNPCSYPQCVATVDGYQCAYGMDPDCCISGFDCPCNNGVWWNCDQGTCMP